MGGVNAALTAILALIPVAQAAGTEPRQVPGELAVEATVPRGGFSMEFGFDALWMMSDGRLVRVNTADNSAIDIDLPGGDGPSLVAGIDQYRDLAVGEGGVWVPEMASSTIHKVDPSTRKVVLSIPSDMFGSIGSIGVGDDSVWAITFDNHNRTLTRYDALNGSVTAQVTLPRPSTGVLYADGSVWVTAASAPELYRIDPGANEVAATISIQSPTHMLAAGEGAVWLAFKEGVVQRIDTLTGAVAATIETGHRLAERWRPRNRRRFRLGDRSQLDGFESRSRRQFGSGSVQAAARHDHGSTHQLWCGLAVDLGGVDLQDRTP